MNFKLGMLQFFIVGAYASYFNFFTLFLKEQGFSTLTCGVIQAIIAILTFAYQPLVGYLIDCYFGYKKMVMLSMGLLILVAVGVPFIGKYSVLIAVFVTLHAVIMRQIPTLIDGMTIAIRTEHKEVSYGMTRGLGSVGAGVMSVVIGWIIAYIGYDKIFWVNALILGVALVLIIRLEDKSLYTKKEKNKDFKGNMKYLFKQPIYMTFMMSAFFLSIGIKIINTFGPLMIQEVGGDSATYGYTMFVCGLVEAATLIGMGWLTRKFSLEKVYLLAIVTQGMGSVMMFMSDSLMWFVVGRCLSSITYSIYIAMLVGYVRKLMSPALYGLAMGVLVAGTGGIAQILSSLGGGLMLEVLAFSQVAWIMVGLVVVTAVLFIPNIVRAKKIDIENRSL